MTKELWKDIHGYEGLYQISNLGRVKRIEKEVMQFNHQLQKEIPVKYPKKYLKFDLAKGYNRVTLSKNNKQERFLVHRLVAEHFIPNKENKPHVNHINHNRIDNKYTNLEWCTQLENEHHKRNSINKPFISISPEGEEREWLIQMECARTLKLQKNGIWRCLNGDQENHRGYKFRYKTPTN